MKQVLVVLTLLALCSCQSAYYKTMESMGYHKREILVDRVEEANDAQEDAQEQFQSALEQFKSVVEFDGGELEKQYDKLKSEYDDSVNAANTVSKRIEKIDSVAKALFKEWERELDEYSSPTLKADSKKKLNETKDRYKNLLKTLRSAESKMAPVLAALKDNVLYLKHNLNARAVGKLKIEFSKVKKDIDVLVGDMNAAIKESNDFIKTLK